MEMVAKEKLPWPRAEGEQSIGTVNRVFDLTVWFSALFVAERGYYSYTVHAATNTSACSISA